MGLTFTADPLHTFSIKIFLVKYPIKWPSLNIWGERSSGLRYYNQNRKVPGSNPTWQEAGLFITVSSVLSQPTFGNSERGSLTNPMFIKIFSAVLIWSSPGALKQLNHITRWTLDQNCYNAVIKIRLVGHYAAKLQLKKISDLLSFLRYQRKCVFKFLFSQLMS